MCGINIVDNWILQMNYPNVVTNSIMSLADVFNTPLTLGRKKKINQTVMRINVPLYIWIFKNQY